VTIHVIHGIHTEGVSPVEGLIPYLVPYAVKYPDYGYILGIETRIVNPIVIGSLLPYIAKDDIIIGHSNGCAIAYSLVNSGAPVAGLIFINAALQQDIICRVPWIDVYYNAGDDITEAAKLGAELGIDDPVWGAMGHGGYLGNDKRVTNYNCAATTGLPVVCGHSDFFTPSKLAAWGPFLAKNLQAHLQ
jgi:hypothetical protein